MDMALSLDKPSLLPRCGTVGGEGHPDEGHTPCPPRAPATRSWAVCGAPRQEAERAQKALGQGVGAEVW